MDQPQCIFCGVTLTLSSLNQPDSRTKEHAYARWFRDYVVNNKIKLFTSDGTTDTFHEQIDLKQFWYRSVCAGCNNGWMSQLEQAVDPTIDKLTSGTDFKLLSPAEVETVARWSGKTAIILGYLSPHQTIVAEPIRRSFVPDSATPPQMRLFYSAVYADKILEGAYLNIGYAPEIPVLGSNMPAGIRCALCVYNHLFTVDFPPMLAGLEYDLSDSISEEVWPSRVPAGTAELNLTPPVPIGKLLLRVCNGIRPRFNLDAIHV